MISVVLPTRNSAAHLASQLQALAEQEYAGRWELIVADNGSRDNTRAVVQAHAKRLPSVRVVDASHRRGSACARNVGVEEAAGQKIAFCDSDDVVTRGWLGAISRALDAHELVGGPLLAGDINPDWLVRTEPWLASLEKGLASDDFLPWASAANLGVRRDLHERLSGFDENFLAHHDRDYCWRAAMAGARLVFVRGAAVHIRLHPSRRAIYRRARLSAEYQALLLRKFEPFGRKAVPVPFTSWLTLWGLPGLILRDLPASAGSRVTMALWWRQLGLRVGSLRGTIRFGRAIRL